jgi:hypothetical protein
MYTLLTIYHRIEFQVEVGSDTTLHDRTQLQQNKRQTHERVYAQDLMIVVTEMLPVPMVIPPTTTAATSSAVTMPTLLETIPGRWMLLLFRSQTTAGN